MSHRLQQLTQDEMMEMMNLDCKIVTYCLGGEITEDEFTAVV